MGKRQHQKDKMYLTYTEWSELYGGKKFESAENEYIKFKRLPFDHCCITLSAFEMPYSDLDGNIFDLEALIAFLQTFKVNPVTGKPTKDTKNFIKLNFHKNADNEFHCPALFKPFTKNSHIVAIATTGNVFCWEAIEQLNIKPKNWKDLVDDTAFQRKDIIVIQDPLKLEKFDISRFYHIKHNLRVLTEDEIAEKKDPKSRIKTMNHETKETLADLEKVYKEPEQEEISEKTQLDKFNSAHYSTGAVAASFTSTAMVPVSKIEAAVIADDLLKYERVKKKGYVRLVTNFGVLNIELYCDAVPKTCDNFISLCSEGYYNNLKFHRSIKNFMIQGGDPTGKGTGGQSIWKKKFEDEFKPNLSHNGRGILSMANSGPNTNGSQFFITYRSCKHLDGKHTVFGKLVGGLDTLNELEKIEVDNKDCPIEDIIIETTQVFVNPFQEALEELQEERKAEEEKKNAEVLESEKKKKRMTEKLTVYREGVGKYLKIQKDDSPNTPPLSKRKASSNVFGNFSSWQ